MVWSTQSIVLLSMSKLMMQADLYLDLQPACKQNANLSEGVRHISQSLHCSDEI